MNFNRIPENKRALRCNSFPGNTTLRNNLSSEQAEEAGRGFPLGYCIISGTFLVVTWHVILSFNTYRGTCCSLGHQQCPQSSSKLKSGLRSGFCRRMRTELRKQELWLYVGSLTF